MDKTLNRLKLLFLALFLVGAVAAWVYQIMWVAPHRECDRRGAWWSERRRVCAVPIDITQITGRPLDAPPMPSAAGPPAQPAAAPAPTVQPPANEPTR